MPKTLEDEVRDTIENSKEAASRYQSATGTGLDMRLQGIEDAIYRLASAIDASSK